MSSIHICCDEGIYGLNDEGGYFRNWAVSDRILRPLLACRQVRHFQLEALMSCDRLSDHFLGELANQWILLETFHIGATSFYPQNPMATSRSVVGFLNSAHALQKLSFPHLATSPGPFLTSQLAVLGQAFLVESDIASYLDWLRNSFPNIRQIYFNNELENLVVALGFQTHARIDYCW
jgi:hypothetical protein